MTTLVRILAQFLRDPSGIYFGSDLLEKVDCSMASLYRILEVLESQNLVLKYRQAYTFNSFCIGDVNFYRNILPTIPRAHKYTAILYMLRYLLYDLDTVHTIAEIKILIKRSRRDIDEYFSLLESEKLIKQKSDLLWIWEPDIAQRLRKSGLITLHKNIWSHKC
jgi:hypothetical protein